MGNSWLNPPADHHISFSRKSNITSQYSNLNRARRHYQIVDDRLIVLTIVIALEFHPEDTVSKPLFSGAAQALTERDFVESLKA